LPYPHRICQSPDGLQRPPNYEESDDAGPETASEAGQCVWAYVLARNIRYQQDLVDQHCNLSEKRLARILLRFARFDGHPGPETTVPAISHETLAEMVGTTRSRICFFMNRFKKSGFIYYEHKSKLLRVHRTLLAFCGQ
jgi:hypothetical protein